jgi:type III restriction enzyme
MATVIENPILNSPYEMPTAHWRFDDDGITDQVDEGRRPSAYFMPIPASKRRQAHQQELEFVEWTKDRIEETKFVNDLRAAVDRWRKMRWPGVTPVTRLLLEHWTNSERETKLFFCQIEAIETAIWLAEIAGKDGRYFLNEIQRFNEDANPGLLRIAHKMATGTGKTVVMSMLIAWQVLNKDANSHDARFANAFLVIAPGITIRDRLRVLLPSDPENYYRSFDLVPTHLREQLGQARIVVTNFHAFQRREKVTMPKATRELLGADNGGAFTETPDQMVRRVCRDLGTKRGIVVINDEAHHCYRRKPDGEDETRLVADEKAEVRQRDEEARIWLTGLEAVANKLGIRSIYDLSATPFFLKGSGYAEGTLFPWVVSDFGLVDAIEAGLVKIPRVPIEDDTLEPGGMPTYRNLWGRIRDDLPKKGRDTDAVTGPPQLPAPLEGALHSLYANYAKSFERWSERNDDSPPPVFIVVCNNTNVSKLVFDYVAGYKKIQTDGSTVVVPGALNLFSNEQAGSWTHKPVTILVDSVQLDRGDALSPEFKRAAAAEIEEFKREYRQRLPGADVEKLTDEDILREVMNTVGKPGRLGSHVRCVVSVSMLTEGWDANTVSHILGIRAFGTQLLCEQVVGRGLRRRSFVLDDEGRFSPEYAEVYGVPFSFIPASGTTKEPPPRQPISHVRSLPERASSRMTFPRLDGYRWEIPDENLSADWTDESRMTLDAHHVPTTTEVAGIVGESEIHTLDDLKAQRVQTVAFELAKVVLDRYFTAPVTDDPRTGTALGARPWLYPRLSEIARSWMSECVTCRDNAFIQLLLLYEYRSDAADRIYNSIIRSAGGDRRLVAMLKPYDTVGSTDWVDFDTTKPIRPTDPEKCHINFTVADSGWEHRMDQALEQIPEVLRYVKNQGLGFTIPYSLDGQPKSYYPDFLVDLDDGRGEDDPLHLIIEVTGKRDREKAAKVDTAKSRWIPAVNNAGRFGRWRFVEVTDPYEGADIVRAIAAESNKIGVS